MRFALLSLFILLPMSFFDHASLRPTQERTCQGTPVPITQLGPKRTGPRSSYTYGSFILKPLRVVIRDREAWSSIWKQIHSPDPNHPPPGLPPLPEVDFARQMVIVVALGQRPTSGYSIVVDGACERGDRLEIAVRSTSPGKACILAESLTQPIDIVRLAKTEHSVVFKETKVVHECK